MLTVSDGFLVSVVPQYLANSTWQRRGWINPPSQNASTSDRSSTEAKALSSPVDDAPTMDKSNVLLVGPTGSGMYNSTSLFMETALYGVLKSKHLSSRQNSVGTNFGEGVASALLNVWRYPIYPSWLCRRGCGACYSQIVTGQNWRCFWLFTNESCILSFPISLSFLLFLELWFWCEESWIWDCVHRWDWQDFA